MTERPNVMLYLFALLIVFIRPAIQHHIRHICDEVDTCVCVVAGQMRPSARKHISKYFCVIVIYTNQNAR